MNPVSQLKDSTFSVSIIQDVVLDSGIQKNNDITNGLKSFDFERLQRAFKERGLTVLEGAASDYPTFNSEVPEVSEHTPINVDPIDLYYTLHIAGIDGRQPTIDELCAIAQAMGARIEEYVQRPGAKESV